MWYQTSGCATGVLPDDRACYRRVTERPGVLRTTGRRDDRTRYRRATGRPGVLLACYRTSGVLTNDEVRYRCVTERPGVSPVCRDVRFVMGDV